MTRFCPCANAHARRNCGDFGRVAVMLGGSPANVRCLWIPVAPCWSAAAARCRRAAVGPGGRTLAEFAAAGFERVWIALHGPGGEDGALQGALQWLDTPYTGSGVMASAIAMDKIRSKHLFDAAGIPTPEYAVIRHRADAYWPSRNSVSADSETGGAGFQRRYEQSIRTRRSGRCGRPRTAVRRRCAG